MTAKIILATILIYAGSYVAFRQTHIEVRSSDQRAFVIFPEGKGMFFYYLWRPLCMLDGWATGMNFHIGPHR